MHHYAAKEDANTPSAMCSQGDMQISAMHPHRKGPGELVHQSVNSRNKLEVSAGDKLGGASFDGIVEEHGRRAARGLL